MLYTRKGSDFIFDVSVTRFADGDEDGHIKLSNGDSIPYVETPYGRKAYQPHLFLVIDEMGNKDLLSQYEIDVLYEVKKDV